MLSEHILPKGFAGAKGQHCERLGALGVQRVFPGAFVELGHTLPYAMVTHCSGVQDAAAADRAVLDFRRSSHILDLADLDAEEAALAKARAAGALSAAGRATAPQLEYTAAEVAGYAATRLPACYAVLVKVPSRTMTPHSSVCMHVTFTPHIPLHPQLIDH